MDNDELIIWSFVSILLAAFVVLFAAAVAGWF